MRFSATFSMKALAALALSALMPATAHAEWREATSPHFIVVSEGSESQLRDQSRKLEAVHWLMGLASSQGDASGGRRVRIYMLDTAAMVRARAGVAENSSMVAVYFHNALEPTALAARNRPVSDLFHEYGHHFMFEYMGQQFPPWFIEGFAEVISTASFEREGAITYGKVANERRYELQQGTWTPTAQMFAERTSGDRHAGVASYGQYWLTAHYLLFSPDRRGQLRRYITAINNRVDPDEAAESSFTGGITQLDNDLRSYLRAANFRYVAPPLSPEVMRDPTIRVLRPSEAAAISLQAEASRTRGVEDNEALAVRVAALAARFPAEPVVHALHASVLFSAEKWDEAIAAADRGLAIDPAHARSNALRALAMYRAAAQADGPPNRAAMTEIDRYLERARASDPREPALQVLRRTSRGE